MQAQEAQAENLALVDEMPDVRPAEAGAGRARAAVVERTRIPGEPRVPEVESALPREGAPGSGRARRQHAVEHVDAARDHLDHAFGVADAHEVPRLPGREEGRSEERRVGK